MTAYYRVHSTSDRHRNRLSSVRDIGAFLQKHLERRETTAITKMNQGQMIALQVLFIVAMVPVCCHGYSAGPPYSRCYGMYPYHLSLNKKPTAAQNIPSPYVITVSKGNYSTNETLNVTISGSTFKGFIIQARSNDSAVPWPVGSFIAIPDNSRYMFCPGSLDLSPENTVGQVNRGRPKKNWTERHLTWKAPAISAGDIRFWATVVHNYTTFWVKLKSDLIIGPSAAVTRPNDPPLPDFTITKAGCNATKSCMSWPSNCTDSNDCKYLLVYSVSGNNMTIEMSAKNKYVAVGFNDLPEMNRGDDIICTMLGTGDLQGRVYVNAKNSPERKKNSEDVSLLQAAYSNQTIKCRVLRKVKPQANYLKNLTTNRFIIAAYGEATSTGNIQYHSKANRWSTAKKVNIAKPAIHEAYTNPPTNPPTTGNEVTKIGCGTSKGCYSEPTSCKNNKDCDYLVTFQKSGDNIVFELSSKSAWVALGFNENQGKMAGSDTMMCAYVNDKVELHHYDLKERDLPTQTTLSNADATQMSGVRDGGNTRCKFWRKISPGNSVLKSLDKTWYLVFGYGTVSGNNIRKHSKTPSNSAFKIDIRVAQDIKGGGVAKLVKAHGCLMTIAWLGFATIGIFMARYMRLAWEDNKICGNAVWFVFHRGFMVTVWVLSITGLILIFVHVNDWSSIGAHPFVGIVAVGLAFIQPFMALLRPHPGTDNRYIFNWVHRFVGLSALILAVATLFLAVYIESLGLKDTGLYVLVAYCIGIGLVIVFEIVLCARASRSQGFSTAKKPGKVEQMEMEVTPTASDCCLRQVMLTFVTLLSIGTAIALVVLVAIA